MKASLWLTIALVAVGAGVILGTSASGASPRGLSTPTPTPVPSPTIVPGTELSWGDTDCDGSLTLLDFLRLLRYEAAVKQMAWANPCLEINTTVLAGGADQLWGDIDCSDSVDAIDALKLLTRISTIPVPSGGECPDIDTNLAIDQSLETGVSAWFTVGDEDLYAWVTNPQTIQQLYDLSNGTSQASIPNGKLKRGPGQDQHNSPWSWHFDPNDIEMAEVTIEVCDGLPSYVEDHLGDFGRYCPWSAELKSLTDYRP